MSKSSACILKTNTEKGWPYDEYYIGEKDLDERRTGKGEQHWTGAESIERYKGTFVRDTMHGSGDYRWRYKGRDGIFVTYEGRFFNNSMHGYGTMSYPDGRVFTGLYNSNIRWGPGIESHATVCQNVGLWRGTQLVRLSWRPDTPSLAPALSVGSQGRATVEPHRIMLASTVKIIGETNKALELLKQYGCDPLKATEKWTKLYPKNCTDQGSQFYEAELFQRAYYRGKIDTLEIVDTSPETSEETENQSGSFADTDTYFAWNNNELIIDMMKHCFTHEKQRKRSDIANFELTSMLAGPRTLFKPAGQHEIDCRTLLMTSYLGYITNVVRLINECNVYPDITDNEGNSAVMYATCGDQASIIQFLVEAGADVNMYNDSCCTPLGIALVRYVCVQCDLAPNNITQALLVPPVVPLPTTLPEQKVFEWNIFRELSPLDGMQGVSKMKLPVLKRTRSTQVLYEAGRRKTDTKLPDIPEIATVGSLSEDDSINREYITKVKEYFITPISPVPYLFEINDMVKVIDVSDEDQKKVPDKNLKKTVSKVLKETMKLSKETMWKTSDKDFPSINSAEVKKSETLGQIMQTILQLLYNGANPRLVTCPQPALLMAVVAGSPDLIQHLINHGADANETYPKMLRYSSLHVAMSLPLTKNNLNLIRKLLECGSKTSHRLPYLAQEPDIPGPTLLHAALAKTAENEEQEEILREILELLLKYKCDPTAQFKGRSAVHVVMTKMISVFDIFINSSTTNLNAPINDLNQSILVKMFSKSFFQNVTQTERLQILTNLLLFGADPLMQCQDGAEAYQNIFVFIKKTLTELESAYIKVTANPVAKSDPKNKQKDVKPTKKEEKSTGAKSTAKMGTDDVADYRQAHELVTDCARLLYIRWLQAKLTKELLTVIDRYTHRRWNMILKEHNNKKSTGLWLTAQRCLEIWDILKTTKKKIYNTDRGLKHLLCIVEYYHKKNNLSSITGVLPTTNERYEVEYKVTCLLREYKIGHKLSQEVLPPKRHYVKPELSTDADNKYNVCFECILPLDIETKIKCKSCKLVAFCSFDCMKMNIIRSNCHPCSDYLKNEYFPSQDFSCTNDLDI